jgi:hypothetical protein
MISRSIRAAAAAVLVGIACHGHVAADDAPAKPRAFETLVPPDTFAFASWPDVEHANAMFEHTALMELWREPEMQAFCKSIVELVTQKQHETLDSLQLKVPDDLDSRLKVGQIAFSVGTAVVDGAEAPGVAVGVQIRGDVGAARDFVAPLMDKVAQLVAGVAGMGAPHVVERQYQGVTIRSATIPSVNGKDLDLCYTFVDSLFVGALNRGYLEHIVDAAKNSKSPSLADDPLFKSATGKVRSPASSFVGFVNVEALMKRFATVLPPDLLKMLQALGLDLIKAVAVSETIEGKSIRDSFYLHAPGERHGLLSVCSAKRCALSTAKIAPRETVFFDSSAIDLASVYDGVLDTIKKLDTGTHGQIVGHIQSLERALGVRLREDLIASLGDEMGTFVTLPTGASPLPEIGISLTLSDPAKCAATLGAVQWEKLGVRAKDVDFNGTAIRYFELPAPVPLSPAYGISGKFLFVAGSVQTLKQMITRSQGNDEGLLGNAAFRSVKDKIPADASWIEFIDLPRIGSFLINSVGPLLGPLAKEYHLPLDPALLPTSETVAKHLDGYIAYYRNDREGMSMICESTFGSGLLLVGYAAIVANVWTHAGETDAIAAAMGAKAGDAQSYRELAARDRMAGRWTEAERHLTQAIAKAPADASLYFERGTVNHALARYAAAREDFQRAAKSGYFPDRCEYWVARSHAKEGDKDSAIRALERSRKAGYPRIEDWSVEPDFTSLADDPRFRSLVAPR